MNSINIFKNSIDELMSVLKKSETVLSDVINQSAKLIIDSVKNNGKLIICGNGGSAADSQHFAAELVGRFKKERMAIPAISLTVDTSIITAWSNDYSFNTVFSRQIEAIGKKEDTLFAISTSGNSKNTIEAIKAAKKIGMKSIALTGNGGGAMKEIADSNIIVPSNNTPRIQEVHTLIIHILCEIIENRIINGID